jgi:VWFA-related protein
MRASGFSSLSFTTLLALLTAASLAAQETTLQPSAGDLPAEGQPFVDSIDVQVVNLEVFVTDRQGQRVGGLTREDFEVLEDGRPIQVSNFYAVAGGQTEVPGGSALLMAAEPGEAAEDTAAGETLPLEQRLNLAIVIDDLSLDARNRNRLLLAIGNAVLPRLRPDDRVLVGVLGGSSVKIAQRLSSDPNQLRTTLEQISRTAPAGVTRLAEKRDVLRQIEGIGLLDSDDESDTQTKRLNESVVREIYPTLQDYARKRAQEGRSSLNALTRFIDSLAGLPGRKAVLYAGGGLSLRPGEALFEAWHRKFNSQSALSIAQASGSTLEGLREDLTKDFERLVARANANRVTFYTLGLTEEISGISAETGNADAWRADLDNLEKMNLGQSLNLLAGGTGGLSGVDLADPRSMLARMREDFDAYYSLGYVPDKESGQGDAKNHKIEVRVRGRNDLTVRHREGRRDQTRKERMTGRTLTALILEPGANPLQVAIEIVGDELKPEKKTHLVAALVKFPLSRLVLLPGERFQEGRVTLFLGAQDSQGRLSPIQEIQVPIQVPTGEPEALAKTAAYRAVLELRPEAHRIAVSIRDELGNTDSAVVMDYTPGVKK